MEVCGGQTHAIARWGIDDLLPEGLELVHGPGCPVCVTPAEVIEHARHLAVHESVVLTTFGDMLRVPGTRGDFLSARAEGADVRLVLSPLDALELARRDPEREVVFFAVGFETTAPAVAKKLSAGTITSWPGPIPRAWSPSMSASVPLATPTAPSHPNQRATIASASPTSGPPT